MGANRLSFRFDELVVFSELAGSAVDGRISSTDSRANRQSTFASLVIEPRDVNEPNPPPSAKRPRPEEHESGSFLSKITKGKFKRRFSGSVRCIECGTGGLAGYL
jgi:hypothetical protein